jgi:hypothetical protein
MGAGIFSQIKTVHCPYTYKKNEHMKTEKKEVVCIRLPESIKKKVDAEAKKMYLAPSKLVSIIVQKYYESKN